MNFWAPVDYIIKLINPILNAILGIFGLTKEKDAQVLQTIDNSKKKSSFNIQIGGKKEVHYHIYETYDPGKERLRRRVEVSDSVDSAALTDVSDEEEIVNQYLETQINE